MARVVFCLITFCFFQGNAAWAEPTAITRENPNRIATAQTDASHTDANGIDTGQSATTLSLATQADTTDVAEDHVTQDQVVVASTRNYPSALGRTLDFACFTGYTCGAHGEPCGMPVSLLESDGYEATWIFVHGNQIPPNEAVKRGVAVYRRVRACSPQSGPIRFVIWSWPSERKTNRIKDAKLKQYRTEVEGFLLGSYLAAIAEESPVRLIGYSFGARIVGSALHLASGGAIEGCGLGGATIPVVPYRIVLLAAAMESDGFECDGRYCHGLDHAEYMLLMNNSRDLAIRYFWLLSGSKPGALGFAGAECRPPHVTVHQYDWANQIGKDHRLWQYLDRPFVIGKMANAIASFE